MQQTNLTAGMGGAERKRVEAVVETLATLGCQGESVAEVAHDARNMVTALGLYCDLLEEPGVLTAPFTHYGNELRLVAAASRRLVEKLVALDTRVDTRVDTSFDARADTRVDRRADARADAGLDPSLRANLGAGLDPSLGASVAGSHAVDSAAERSALAAAPANLLEPGLPGSRRHQAPGRWDLIPAAPISNLAAELVANRNLLAALAGPSIALTVDAEGGAHGVRLTGEDLTRVLVNLVKNAAEAMPAGGHIQIGLRERPAAADAGETLVLTIEDNGPGVPAEVLEEIFASGYTTRSKDAQAKGSWPAAHRGLGLSITRSIVEAAGGRIQAASRVRRGARFEIDLPVRKTS
jgi:signal transduction histidine kinase